MQSDVGDLPEWYASLTVGSSFEEFQRRLHGRARLFHVCLEPCAVQSSEAVTPARPPARAEGCHASIEGEECHEKMLVAMREGVLQVQDWYPSP